MKKFLKTNPMKLWMILCALIVFTFFSNDFGLVDIQKTAIILAAGIDRTADGFSLTAQIAVPDETGKRRATLPLKARQRWARRSRSSTRKRGGTPPSCIAG